MHGPINIRSHPPFDHSNNISRGDLKFLYVRFIFATITFFYPNLEICPST